MNRVELERRTKAFALSVIRFTSGVPRSLASDVMGRQLMKAGTAVGAIYREAARAESRRDFVHKVAMSAKEAAEAEYWLELFIESGIGSKEELNLLRKESDELLRILIASAKTAGAKARLEIKSRSSKTELPPPPSDENHP